LQLTDIISKKIDFQDRRGASIDPLAILSIPTPKLIKENIIYYTNSTKTEPAKANSIDAKTTLCQVTNISMQKDRSVF
jgi:hypothetical protein